MKKQYLLQEYYINYLRKVRELKDSSIDHYIGGLSTISKLLKEKKKIDESVYEISDIDDFIVIREFLFKDQDFITKDSIGHNMYSAAINNYLRFAKGDDLFGSKYSFDTIDIPLKAAEMRPVEAYRYKRSSIIKLQSIKAAHYMCESNNGHKTFTAKSNLEQYMEGHHLIPLKKQRAFKYSLDIYANIVSLCPVCHRLLHHGVEAEKRGLLERLYDERQYRLCNSGIELSKRDFLELTL